ncbi:AraC family transcriptional regulator [Spirosoma linguale]|uniref:Helix-turn-helix, AraC domain protein n=1 Tax=Spirosoma linguale (strain ATCC 33905 / DSM 74 / LMG 10896 / Claus 1) TaxID=504472 RepID=D2QDP1_SPILD|nr:Helix-turn-helix, AraC domain protein [Spirosoma linguale DSM 74]
MTEIFENIRQLYQFRTFSNELAEFVEFVSESSAIQTYRHVADQPFTIRMFPSWTPTFYINLGQPYHLVLGAAHHWIHKDADVLILRNNIVERHNLPTDHILTIKFYPGGLEAILGINQVQFIDQVIKLEAILPLSLLQRIKQLPQFDQRIGLIEHYFLGQYQTRKKADYYRQIVSSTIGTFDQSGMQLNTSQLADRMFNTSKTINRYFHRVVGTSPKQYLSVMRARSALTTFVNQPHRFDPVSFGYYDLSHFHKSIRQFTGQSLASQRH